jgi:hypothetical protein
MAIPTKVLAGVTVPDTPLITKALEYARIHLDDVTFNHVIRSWLFGASIASQNPDYKGIESVLCFFITPLFSAEARNGLEGFKK